MERAAPSDGTRRADTWNTLLRHENRVFPDVRTFAKKNAVFSIADYQIFSSKSVRKSSQKATQNGQKSLILGVWQKVLERLKHPFYLHKKDMEKVISGV